MMDAKEGKLYCRPCAARAEEEVAAEARRRKGYNTYISTDAIYRWALVLAVLGALVWVGPRIFFWSMTIAKRGPHEPTQPWAKPPQQWPELVFAVVAAPAAPVSTVSAHYGPNGFFLKKRDGAVVFATVVATEDGGVEPAPPAFAAWSRAFAGCTVQAAKGPAMALSRVLPASEKTFAFGTILLHCDGRSPEGSGVLAPRRTPYTAGMRMFVAGRDPAKKNQTVLPALVTSANFESDLTALLEDRPYGIGELATATSASLVELKEPVVEEQVVGAPVIDVRGNLVAVITDPLGEKDSNGRTTDYLALSVVAILESLGD